MSPSPDNRSDAAARLGGSGRKYLTWFITLLVTFSLGFATSSFFSPASTTSSKTPTKTSTPAPKKPEIDLSVLALGISPEFFTKKVDPQQSVDLCDLDDQCLQPQGDHLTMSVTTSTNLVVRAVFEKRRLVMYLITLRTNSLAPTMPWLDYNLGELGKVSLKDAFTRIDADVPKKMSFLQFRNKASFSTVVSPGAPGKYQGLVLAFDPFGAQDDPIDLDLKNGNVLAANKLKKTQSSPRVLASFEQSTVPNTYGIFKDDGHLHELLENPDNLIYLILKDAPD